jgi:hypothetical protein
MFYMHGNNIRRLSYYAEVILYLARIAERLDKVKDDVVVYSQAVQSK